MQWRGGCRKNQASFLGVVYGEDSGYDCFFLMNGSPFRFWSKKKMVLFSSSLFKKMGRSHLRVL